MTLKSNWVFDDVKNAAAPGWKTGDCKDKEAAEPSYVGPKDLSPNNLSAIKRGKQFADMIGLIGEIAKATYNEQSIPVFRKAMLEKLKSDYLVGSGAYRGQFDNWSFRPTSRSASRTPFIAMRLRGEPHVQLAPTQYARLRSDALRPIQTVYMDLDVERVFRVDDSDKSFFAEFYISMRSNEKFDISSLEFGNAFREADKGAAKVTVSMVHDGAPNGVYPEGVSIARVVGKFMTIPNLGDYPFDTQLFSIQIQPKTYDAAFIIQPPHEKLRDGAIAVDGWKTLAQYVGLDEDYIPITDARSETRSIVPFYKMNFSWVMKRETGDYFLRVVVPLAFILFVGYLSIFIPREHFEAIITIQVTALLSAVALYLSIPKVGSDDATISDLIFLFDYFAVSLMILISIIRISWRVRANRSLDRILMATHAFGIPLLIIGLALYVTQLKLGSPPTFSVVQSSKSVSETKAQR